MSKRSCWFILHKRHNLFFFFLLNSSIVKHRCWTKIESSLDSTERTVQNSKKSYPSSIHQQFFMVTREHLEIWSKAWFFSLLYQFYTSWTAFSLVHFSHCNGKHWSRFILFLFFFLSNRNLILKKKIKDYIIL